MKNEKPKTTKTTKKTTTAKKTSPKKSAKSAKKVSAVQTTEKETIKPIQFFGVMKDDFAIEEYDAETVKTELSKQHSDTDVDKFLSGKTAVLQSDTYVFSSDKDKLQTLIEKKGWAKTETPTPTETETTELEYEMYEPSIDDDLPVIYEDEIQGTSKELLEDGREDAEDFDEVEIGAEDYKFGKSILKEPKAVIVNVSESETVNVDIEIGEILDTDGQEPVENFRRSETALAKPEEVIHGEIEPALDSPLTDEEREQFDKLNKEFKKAKGSFDKGTETVRIASLDMMRIASEVRAKLLYREAYKSIEAWAEHEHGITREYIQNLAQYGDFRAVLTDVAQNEKLLPNSVRATRTMTVDINKMAKLLGVAPSDFDTMKPVIEATQEIIETIATDENGKPNSIAPRVSSAVNEILPEIIQTGLVEVEGEQIKIADALALGEDVLKGSVHNQILETVGEQIKSRNQQIADYLTDKKDGRTKPHEAVKPSPKKNTEYYQGVAPAEPMVYCILHVGFEDNKIVKVFNAGFQTACNCKFQLIEGYEGFQCIEADGLEVEIK